MMAARTKGDFSKAFVALDGATAVNWTGACRDLYVAVTYGVWHALSVCLMDHTAGKRHALTAVNMETFKQKN